MGLQITSLKDKFIQITNGAAVYKSKADLS